jgi:DNA-binding CsgD family transcriptional regulator
MGQVSGRLDLAPVRGDMRGPVAFDVAVRAGAPRPTPARDRGTLRGTPPTARELEVLRAVVDHAGEKGAAAALGIRPRTVNNCLRTLRERTGAGTTGQLVYVLRDRL